jgi:hypothetical protein
LDASVALGVPITFLADVTVVMNYLHLARWDIILKLLPPTGVGVAIGTQLMGRCDLGGAPLKSRGCPSAKLFGLGIGVRVWARSPLNPLFSNRGQVGPAASETPHRVHPARDFVHQLSSGGVSRTNTLLHLFFCRVQTFGRLLVHLMC